MFNFSLSVMLLYISNAHIRSDSKDEFISVSEHQTNKL